MTAPLRSLPRLADWRAAASRLGLRRQGGELVGPCPACGGTDRFRVTRRGGFFCRQCCPDGRSMDAVRRILDRAGLAGPEDGEGGPRRNAAAIERGAGSRREGRSWGYRDTGGGPERRSTALPGLADSPETGQGRNTGADSPDPLPGRIWAAATADPRLVAPVRRYFASRGAWPPDRLLPPAVRWLPRTAAAHLDESLAGGPDARRAVRLPRAAAGAAVYGFAGDGGIQAVQIEPLAASGRRTPWPPRRPDGPPVTRQSRGPMRGAAFRVPGPDNAAYAVHVAEGPVDALAIATWRGVRAWAAGGTSGLPALASALAATGRAAVIEADGDGPGRQTAAALQDALHGAGAAARLHYWPGCDPAEGLAAAWGERAAVLEADGMDRREAETAAWCAMIPPDKDAPGQHGGPTGRKAEVPRKSSKTERPDHDR